jgi:hypothetical protein
LLRLALDTNALIDLENERPPAPYIRQLLSAFAAKKIDLSVLGISASENPKSGKQLRNFSEFQNLLNTLGCSSINCLKPIGYWDITFWDWSISPTDQDTQLLHSAHRLMFPNIDPDWQTFAASNGHDANDPISKASAKWRNAHCDAQAVWACIRYDQDFFVTSNTTDFQRHATELANLGMKRIVTPHEALQWLPI